MKKVKCTLLSIDAWRECEGSWTWNAWYKMQEGMYIPESMLTPRKVLRLLRRLGYLSDDTKGCVSVEDDGYNYTIKLRGTDEPLLALDYGSHWEDNGL